MKPILIALIAALLTPCLGSAQTLQKEIEKAIRPYKAQVGVAVIIDHSDTVCVNNDCHYPMLSVFKLHQALYVAHRMQASGAPLDTCILVRKKDLAPNTYSPLRDRYPDGNVRVSVSELLRYSVQLSDNNACDILFRHFGGPRHVDRYIRSLGFSHFAIRHDENAMHRRLARCYDNRTSPLDAAALTDYARIYERPRSEHFEYVFSLLEHCTTGQDRLVAPLVGTEAVVGHKTGTGDRNTEGRIIGTNDVGYVWNMPNRRSYSIAVFVKDSEETPETTAAIIAQVSGIVYRYVCGLPPMPM